MRANFSVRRFASVGSDKDDSLEFGLTKVEASFGDGTSNFVTLSEGKGVLLSTPNGVALQAEGSVIVSAPGVEFGGEDNRMRLKINNVDDTFKRDVEVGGEDINLDLPEGPYTKFEGKDLKLK